MEATAGLVCPWLVEKALKGSTYNELGSSAMQDFFNFQFKVTGKRSELCLS